MSRGSLRELAHGIIILGWNKKEAMFKKRKSQAKTFSDSFFFFNVKILLNQTFVNTKNFNVLKYSSI